MKYRFSINSDEVARQVGAHVDNIRSRVVSEVEKLSISTHAFIVAKAQSELQGYIKEAFLGKDGKNVRWVKVSNNIWAVEIDEKARWVEEGRCVCYGSRTNSPLILTSNGYKNILDLQIGDYALNQFGKWTKVLAIHDQPLFPESELKWHKVQASKWPKKSGKLLTIEYLGICPQCGYERRAEKYHHRLQGSICPHCVQQRTLIQIKVLHGERHHNTLTLTEDHPVLTQRGWVPAGELISSDRLAYPSYELCFACGRTDVHWGDHTCSAHCRGVRAMQQVFKNGSHVSQNPQKRSEYCRKMGGHSMSGSKAEHAVAKLIGTLGYSVGFFGDDARCIRQYPVPSVKKDNRQYYYYADFFFPEYNLALEVDGAPWHKNIEREQIREAAFNGCGIRIMRIDASLVHQRTPLKLKKAVTSILRNHSGEITLKYDTVVVKTKKLSAFSNIRRRWDITVEDGESFVCQGIVIHNSKMFMRWLLDNNPKAKTAKDGSRYAHIPFTHAKLAGRSDTMSSPKDMYDAVVRKAMQDNKIPLKKIERNADGTPKLGILHTLTMTPPGTPSQYPGMFSMPRTPEMANLTGLSPHGGIYHLKGVMVTQRLNQKGKPVREAITIRTISSKSEGEGRWMAPEVQPFGALKAAQEFAEKEWQSILEAIKRDFR